MENVLEITFPYILYKVKETRFVLKIQHITSVSARKEA